jgi:tRNA (cmo5U34)-methyltransferase
MEIRITDNSTPHRANEYDSQIRKTIPFYDVFHRETIDVIRGIAPKPAVWLDSGCGTGTLIENALPCFPETVFYLSDPSVGMLEQAKSKLQAQNNQRVHFLSPIKTSEIPDAFHGKHDVITAILSHHYLSASDRIATTRKCHDLLKKGGLYITFENTMPFTDEGIEIGKRRWKEYQIHEGRSVDTVEKHMSRFNTEYFPITVDDHLKLLGSVGFRVVELFWFSIMQSGYYCIK